jgi:hypothetical protein
VTVLVGEPVGTVETPVGTRTVYRATCPAHGPMEWRAFEGGSEQPCGPCRWERDRRAREVRGSVRRPPRPPFETTAGVCSMCGGPLPGRRRSWCSDDCVDIWNVATRQPDALRHLVELHGRECWACGDRWTLRERTAVELLGGVLPANRVHGERCYVDVVHGPPCPTPVRLEVDHIRPLWSLNDEERRELRWWLPYNLQLLCGLCHKAKTRAEAAERARLRRGDPVPTGVQGALL